MWYLECSFESVVVSCSDFEDSVWCAVECSICEPTHSCCYSMLDAVVEAAVSCTLGANV